jgi:hypothetical protein
MWRCARVHAAVCCSRINSIEGLREKSSDDIGSVCTVSWQIWAIMCLVAQFCPKALLGVESLKRACKFTLSPEHASRGGLPRRATLLISWCLALTGICLECLDFNCLKASRQTSYILVFTSRPGSESMVDCVVKRRRKLSKANGLCGVKDLPMPLHLFGAFNRILCAHDFFEKSTGRCKSIAQKDTC